MEVKINREIRNYTESMFFGLSMRQFVFSLLAIGVAVALSWIVILAAAPFGALGFFSYHGMSAGRFLRVWFRSEILEPVHLRVQPTNLYYEALKSVIEAHEREVYKRHDKDTQ